MASPLVVREQLHGSAHGLRAPAKAQPVRACSCGTVVTDNYHIRDGQIVCDGCFQSVMDQAVQRRVLSEQNGLLKKVCPACRRRICREG